MVTDLFDLDIPAEGEGTFPPVICAVVLEIAVKQIILAKKAVFNFSGDRNSIIPTSGIGLKLNVFCEEFVDCITINF